MLGKIRLLLWIGIVLLFLPFFGVPDWFRTLLTIVIGIMLIYLAFVLKHSYKKFKFKLRQGELPPEETTTIHG